MNFARYAEAVRAAFTDITSTARVYLPNLTAAGQDPAQASSIILTTVTDVVGFLSFLGLATLLAATL